MLQVNRPNLLRYSLLALPLSFAGLPVYLLAPDFYAVHQGLSLATLGLCLLALRFADAFIDPLIGTYLDRNADQFRILMGRSAITLGVGLLMLFWVPDWLRELASTVGDNLILIWFCLAIFITTLAYSLLTIGYGAQGANWSNEHKNQVRITSMRETFSLLGLIFAVTLPFLLMELLSANLALRIVALLLVVLLFVSYLVYSALPLRLLNRTHSEQSLPSPNRHLLGLYLIYALSTLASAIPAVLVIFFVRDYLGLGNAAGGFLLLYFVAGAISIAFWQRVAQQRGKLFAWQASMALAILFFAAVLTLEPGDAVLFAFICIATGFALGAELAIPPALLSEIVGTARGSTGLKYSGLTCINKLALALAAGLTLPMLSYIGFQPAEANSPEALRNLLWLYGGLPCVLKMIAFVIASRNNGLAKQINS